MMGFLEHSNSYQVRLRLSWTTIGANVTIILFQIIVKIVEFFRLRKEKKQKGTNTEASITNASQ